MTRYNLKVPPFQILLGTDDITEAVVGFSFRHPLAEPSTPLIWTGTIELFPVRSGHPRSFFDDEANPSRWLSGLQPIDVYFNNTLWQRFRIKPNGYKFNQDNGQAEIEITDIIGILDSYVPSADAPEFKTGGNNPWNQLAVNLIKKQASLMGISITVEAPPYGIGGIYKVPRTVKSSYIKEAQKMAGERGYWMWSDREVIKWAQYPINGNENILWRRSRKELLNYTRQQGLDPYRSKITVSATHEDIDTCKEQYPRTSYTFAAVDISYGRDVPQGQNFQTLVSKTVQNKTGNYTYTKTVTGNPILALFGGQIQANGSITGAPPTAKGYIVKRLDQINDPNSGAIVYQGSVFAYSYENAQRAFNFYWTYSQTLLYEEDETTYENVPFDALNASKITKRVVTRCEPWAKFADALQYFPPSSWFSVPTSLFFENGVTERTTTTYKYKQIFRTDIIVATGQKLYEIEEISEFKEQLYFYKQKLGDGTTVITPMLVANERTVTTYEKECQGRWREIKQVWQNKGQSTTSQGYLFGVNKTETVVYSIPEITYRPAPYPVIQRPLLSSATTGYRAVSLYVNSNEFASAETLTTTAECNAYAAFLGRLKWQRYYGRELASGYGTVLSYAPFQTVQAGNGAYIRDRFGVSLNSDKDSWQFVEDAIGNKYASITEIAPPLLPYPPVLSTSLTISAVPNLSFPVDIPITPLTVTATGGTLPYTFTSVTLPMGLSISSGGVISGTPSAIATTSVTVTVADSLLASVSTTFSVAIVSAEVPLPITSQTFVLAGDWNELSDMIVMGGIPIPLILSGDWNQDDLIYLNPQNIATLGNTDVSGIAAKVVIGTGSITLGNTDISGVGTIGAPTTISWATMTAQQWADLTPQQWSELTP